MLVSYHSQCPTDLPTRHSCRSRGAGCEYSLVTISLPRPLLSISHALSLKVSEGMAWRPVAGVQKPANVRFTVLVSSRLLDCKQAR